MKILDRLRNRRPRLAGYVSPAEASAHEQSLPIPGYDRLNSKQVTGQLSQLSQVELATVESMSALTETGRFDKLRYMRGSEPLPGYDASAPRRSPQRRPAPTQKRSRPCATTSASSHVAGR